MWKIEGHEIYLTGGPYIDDWVAPHVMMYCTPCPHGPVVDIKLWSDPSESGRLLVPLTGVTLVVRHLRGSGVNVPTAAEEAAAL